LTSIIILQESPEALVNAWCACACTDYLRNLLAPPISNVFWVVTSKDGRNIWFVLEYSNVFPLCDSKL